MPSPSRRSLTAPYAWPASDALLSDWKRAERPLLNTADDHAVPPRRGADRRLRIGGWGTKLATHREIRLPAARPAPRRLASSHWSRRPPLGLRGGARGA